MHTVGAVEERMEANQALYAWTPTYTSLFADDFFIFAEASIEQVMVVKKCFSEFCIGTKHQPLENQLLSKSSWKPVHGLN